MVRLGRPLRRVRSFKRCLVKLRRAAIVGQKGITNGSDSNPIGPNEMVRSPGYNGHVQRVVITRPDYGPC